MTNGAMLFASTCTGLVLGAFFYGGLWWTVRRTLTSPRPALWVLGSALTRMGTVMVGFHLVAGSHAERWVLCVLGLTLARPLVSWITKRGDAVGVGPDQEASHAP